MMTIGMTNRFAPTARSIQAKSQPPKNQTPQFGMPWEMTGDERNLHVTATGSDAPRLDRAVAAAKENTNMVVGLNEAVGRFASGDMFGGDSAEDAKARDDATTRVWRNYGIGEDFTHENPTFDSRRGVIRVNGQVLCDSRRTSSDPAGK